MDGSNEDGGSEGEANKIHQEKVVCERVKAHLYSSNIAENFEDKVAQHADHEASGFVADAEEDLSDQGQGEDGQVQGVTGEYGDVEEGGLEEEESGESTVCIWDGRTLNETRS